MRTRIIPLSGILLAALCWNLAAATTTPVATTTALAVDHGKVILDLLAADAAKGTSSKFRIGVASDETMALQRALRDFPDIYPMGYETGYYGRITDDAVTKFKKSRVPLSTPMTESTTTPGSFVRSRSG